MNHKVVTVLPKVRLATSFAAHSHDVTGGVYKARERIHRDMLIRGLSTAFFDKPSLANKDLKPRTA